MKKFILILFYFQILKESINSCEIIIKIKGPNNQKFVNNNNYHKCPDEIIFINENKKLNNKCESQFEKEENIIILKWNNHINGYELFKGLTSIIEIHFFNCTIINSMHQIFNGCSSLKSINFTGLTINYLNQNVDTMYGTFKNCISLKSIDLSPIKLPSIDYRYFFDGCKNLEYINFINYDETKTRYDKLKLDDIVPKNLVICIKQDLAPILYSSLEKRECTIIYCDVDAVLQFWSQLCGFISLRNN